MGQSIRENVSIGWWRLEILEMQGSFFFPICFTICTYYLLLYLLFPIFYFLFPAFSPSSPFLLLFTDVAYPKRFPSPIRSLGFAFN